MKEHPNQDLILTKITEIKKMGVSTDQERELNKIASLLINESRPLKVPLEFY